MKKLILTLSLILIGCTINVDDTNVNLTGDMKIIPDIPKNINAIPKNGMITITWDNENNATGYNVYYSTIQGVHDVKIQNVNSPFNHTVPNDNKVYYVVTAKNDIGESDYSVEVSATSGIIDNKNGSISIIKDGLKWAKCSQTNYYGGNSYELINNDCSYGVPGRLNYCPTQYDCDDTIKLIASASDAYNSCYFLGIDGGGWRVPNADELILLHNSYIKEPSLWPDIVNDAYWSTNAYLSNWNEYVLINIISGGNQPPPGNSQAYLSYVLCVK